MSDMDAFYTREAANNGIKVPLFTPDGSATDHYIMIRGVDSDEFRAADTEARRSVLKFAAIEDPAELDIATSDAIRKTRASLVISWSFEQECTLDNVINFLREAPQLADAIDMTAAKRSLFFVKK